MSGDRMRKLDLRAACLERSSRRVSYRRSRSRGDLSRVLRCGEGGVLVRRLSRRIDLDLDLDPALPSDLGLGLDLDLIQALIRIRFQVWIQIWAWIRIKI